jgi:hypothetical protein
LKIYGYKNSVTVVLQHIEWCVNDIIAEDQLISTDGMNRVAPNTTTVQTCVILETVDFHWVFVEPAMEELISR